MADIAKIMGLDVAAGGLTAFSAGDVLIGKTENIGGTPPVAYEKQMEYVCGIGGALRIKFSLRGKEAAGHIQGRIYRNGGAVGTERTQTGTPYVYVVYSEDIAGWSVGDLCQLYVRAVGVPEGNSKWKDFQIYVATAPGVSLLLGEGY